MNKFKIALIVLQATTVAFIFTTVTATPTLKPKKNDPANTAE